MNRTRTILYTLLVAVLCLAACKEEDDTVEEYVNWQARNATFFDHLSDSVKALADENPGRTDWMRIKAWTKPEGVAGSNADYIVVKVLRSATAEQVAQGSPLYTDSVAVHYQGRLLPSTSYSQGYVFDQSYYGTFDPDVCRPAEFLVSDLITGFSTALLHMHRGDHWQVYIPQELGYGASDASSIPGYSTLIFDLTLDDFQH